MYDLHENPLYHDGDGLEGLGADTTDATAAPAATWWQNLISAGGQIATQVAQVKAAQQIAKTGQVPTAQVNVGVASDTQKMLLYGALGIGVVLLLTTFMKRGRK